MVSMVAHLIVDQEEKVRIFLLGPKKNEKKFVRGVYKPIYIYYITTIRNEEIISIFLSCLKI